ncbi:hypothetical protein CBM2588_A10115 [Cupriavidus taiwanensis]|nr:hypothetical protein CBM2588_A10115 [Cupriavidus taiwanensis]
MAQAQKIAPVACVQNQYNLVQRGDDALVDELAEQGIAFVPLFPLGGFPPIQSAGMSKVAEAIGTTAMRMDQTNIHPPSRKPKCNPTVAKREAECEYRRATDVRRGQTPAKRMPPDPRDD